MKLLPLTGKLLGAVGGRPSDDCAAVSLRCRNSGELAVSSTLVRRFFSGGLPSGVVGFVCCKCSGLCAKLSGAGDTLPVLLFADSRPDPDPDPADAPELLAPALGPAVSFIMTFSGELAPLVQ